MSRFITRVVFSLSLIFILTDTVAAQDLRIHDYMDSMDRHAAVAGTDSAAGAAALLPAEDADISPAQAGPELGFYDSMKVKFIEGNVGFMSLVAITLIVGLTFCIERIIYLSLSEVNTRILLEDIEERIELGDMNAAKEICRETRGPVASVCYQGLMRADCPMDEIERSIVAYGSVQSANLEKGCSWITLCIAIAPSLGFLGTVVGMVMAFEQIQMAGDISPAIVAAGMKVALITTIFGIIAALILQVFYNYILTKIEHLTTQMEEAAIILLDMIMKSRQVQ